tara:strand:+ start:919 stop:1296 length:378 start_codon:yes stop_codon:yes gene_type:complete
MERYAKSSSKNNSLLISKQEGGNRLEDMTGYGKNWPGGMKEDLLKKPVGKDPADIFKQLTIPGLEEAKKRSLLIAERRLNIGNGKYLTPGELGIIRNSYRHLTEQGKDPSDLIKRYGTLPFKGLV